MRLSFVQVLFSRPSLFLISLVVLLYSILPDLCPLLGLSHTPYLRGDLIVRDWSPRDGEPSLERWEAEGGVRLGGGEKGKRRGGFRVRGWPSGTKDSANEAAGMVGREENEMVVILCPMKNSIEHIWHFFHQLDSLTYPRNLIQIAVLVSDSHDRTFERAIELAIERQRRRPRSQRYNRITILRKDFLFSNPTYQSHLEGLINQFISSLRIPKFNFDNSQQHQKEEIVRWIPNTPEEKYLLELYEKGRKFDVVKLLENVSGAMRHALPLQIVRRDLLSRSRNWLLNSAGFGAGLGEGKEEWTMWMDVDVVEVRDSLIQDLIGFSKLGKRKLAQENKKNETEARIVVAPNCMWRTYNEMGGYDRNTWQETLESLAMKERLKPEDVLLEGYTSLPTYRSHLINHPLALSPLPPNSLLEDYHTVPLDGVGGCVLLVPTEVHRMGAIFVGGTGLDHQVETESLARMIERILGKGYIIGVADYHVYHGLYG